VYFSDGAFPPESKLGSVLIPAAKLHADAQRPPEGAVLSQQVGICPVIDSATLSHVLRNQSRWDTQAWTGIGIDNAVTAMTSWSAAPPKSQHGPVAIPVGCHWDRKSIQGGGLPAAHLHQNFVASLQSVNIDPGREGTPSRQPMLVKSIVESSWFLKKIDFRKAWRSQKKEPKPSKPKCKQSEPARTISKIEKRREFARGLFLEQSPESSFKRLYMLRPLPFNFSVNLDFGAGELLFPDSCFRLIICTRNRRSWFPGGQIKISPTDFWGLKSRFLVRTSRPPESYRNTKHGK